MPRWAPATVSQSRDRRRVNNLLRPTPAFRSQQLTNRLVAPIVSPPPTARRDALLHRSATGFQHNIWPASFLVWYFMFPHMIVTIYRPHGYHVLPLLVLGFVVFPSVVGAILPARFGYNYAAAPALFIVLALNAWLAAHTWRTAAITGRLTYVSAAKERLAHAAAEGERRRAATVRRSLQRIAARERLLTDVVTFMSHHVRNPVHAISNLTGVVLSRIGKSDLMKPVPTSPGSSNAEDLSLVLQSATQLATLVDDIESLEILRMGSNEDKLELHTPAHMHSWLVAACSRATYGMRNNIDVALGLGVPDIVRFAKAGIGPVVRLALRHASTLAVERAEVSAEWAGGSGAALMEITISALAASADAKSLADQRPFIVLGAPLCHSRLAGAQASISMEWHALEWRCVINFPANSSRPVRMSTASTSLTPDGPVAEASTVPAGPPATAGPGVATTARSGGSGDAVSVSVAVGVAGAHAGAGSSASEARTAPAAHEPPRASFSPLAHSAPALWEEPPLLQSPSHNDFVPSPSLVAPRSRALRCLVVEDELINRKVIERMLHRLKCSFDTYADGAEVDVDAVVAGSHDVVLTDIIMPVMRGDTLCKRLRAAGFSRPIIACTANGSLADRAKYALDGFSDVLTKPYTLSRLNEVLARVCASA